MDTEPALLAGRGDGAPGPAPWARARLALRLAGGGLLIATAAIHLDLYLTGYRSIPTIGWLFLFQVIAAFLLGAAVLASGARLAAAAGRILPGHAGRPHAVLVRPGCRRQVGMLRVVRRLLAARERTGDGRARRHRHALVLTRSDGSVQAAYDGHPLYTYVGDSAPGQANGNGLNLNGGLWHELPASG